MDLDTARKHLATLSLARNGVTLGPVGVAAQITDQYRAYRELRDDRAVLASLKDDLDAMATSGSPGARIYASLLLREVDGDAARAHLETMCDSDEPLTYAPGGCMIMASTLGETAADLLGRPRVRPLRAPSESASGAPREADPTAQPVSTVPSVRAPRSGFWSRVRAWFQSS